MEIDPAFEANAQLAHGGEPGMGSLDYPTVTPQPVVALDPFAGDARADAPLPEVIAAAVDIVGLVGVQLVRPA